MVPIHNKGDPQRPKGASKAIGEYVHDNSLLPQSRWLQACCRKVSREKRRL